MGDGLFPAMLEHALGAENLDGFQPGNTFNQVGVLLGRKARPFFDGLLEGLLNIEAVGDEDQHGDDGNHHHYACKHPDNKKEEYGKGEIDKSRNRCGGEKLPHRFKFLQMFGERASGSGTRLHPHAHHLGENLGGQQHIRLFTGNVDKVTAQLPHHKIEGKDHHGPDRQHPERIKRQIGHNLVIDVHGEKRAGDGKQVDQNGGDQHIAIDAAGFEQGAPEPVSITGFQHLGRALVKLELLLYIEEASQILITQLGCGQPLRGITGLRENHFPLAAIFVPLQQNAGATTAHLQYTRQQQGRNIGQWLYHFTGG